MHNIGTVPMFKMHNVGTLVFYVSFLSNSTPTQLQLVGEGVDFVFPLKKEGREKKEEEGRRNPNLASSRRNEQA